MRERGKKGEKAKPQLFPFWTEHATCTGVVEERSEVACLKTASSFCQYATLSRKMIMCLLAWWLVAIKPTCLVYIREETLDQGAVACTHERKPLWMRIYTCITTAGGIRQTKWMSHSGEDAHALRRAARAYLRADDSNGTFFCELSGVQWHWSSVDRSVTGQNPTGDVSIPPKLEHIPEELLPFVVSLGES